ncbi:MAG: VOC family protein [Egibacteraceae bacterium]
MGRPVVHFEILGTDGEALQSFYRDLFDWNIDTNNPLNYGMVDTGAEGGIGGGVSAGQDGTGVRIYIAVDDPQAYLDRVEQMGGTVVIPVTEIPDTVTIALFADPQGNVIGLVKAP